jgi:RNA polymerase sigma factor (sigma-70 family)
MEPVAGCGHNQGVEPTDHELWERARAGDAAAFGSLFDRHARSVYNFCFRRTGRCAVAEDLTSLVFLQAWRRLHRVELQRPSALPWLLGVALNVTRNHHRTMRRHRRAIERLRPHDPTPDAAGDVAERVDAERRMRSVLDAVSDLPETDRDVLTLCAWANLSYADAAGALGIPIGTVRSRLSRARARLAELDGASGHEQNVTTVRTLGGDPS